MTRCFFRIKKSGYYFRIPVGWVGGITNAYRHYTIWFDRKDIANIMRRARNEMVNGTIFKKEKRMLHRIKDLLSKQDTDYYVSSWDNECYDAINNTFDKKLSTKTNLSIYQKDYFLTNNNDLKFYDNLK